MIEATTTLTMRPLLAWCLLCISWVSQAGTHCQAELLDGERLSAAVETANEAHRQLENSGASLALLARTGADLQRYGLRYSHFGFAVRDSAQQRWLVTHLLNRCGSDRSALFQQGLLNFFSDDLFRMGFWLIVPSDTLQGRLKALLEKTPDIVHSLHQPQYNIIANPANRRYQNSNQWGLEVLAAAIAGQPAVHDRVTAQRYLAGSHYRADRLTFALHERLGARLFRANVRFDDHPLQDRATGRFKVVTVGSVFRFLANVDRLEMNRHIDPFARKQ